MKYLKLTLFHLIVISTVVVAPALAITTTPTIFPSVTASAAAKIASPSARPTEAQDIDIKKYREKIASKVAQMRKKDEQVISGEIMEITDTSIKMLTPFDKEESLDLDTTLTKYFKFTGSASETIEKKDLKSGDYILALGPRLEGRINVNEIYRDELYQIFVGRATEVNTVNSTLKIDTVDKSSVIVTVDNKTKISTLNTSSFGLYTNSFGKIKEGDMVHVVFRMTAVKQKTDRVTATQIMHIPSDYFTK